MEDRRCMSENGQFRRVGELYPRSMTDGGHPQTTAPAAAPTLDGDACYRALQTRDARFDGRFFVAVRTTGVYCRPVCSARTPRRENCTFVACAAAAQEAGYRPCLRCRPEASPGTPAWQGTSATVSRGLRLIGLGALDDGSVEDLANRLGVGERHLRRLFVEHLGASPLAVAQTRRLLFAKKLLNETKLPVSEIAFASGFSSIRRFNDAVRSTWDRTPRELRGSRRQGNRASTDPVLSLRLPFRPPFDWDALAGYLAFRAIPGVECVTPDRYTRTLRLDEAVGIVSVEPVPGENHLVAKLRLSGPAPIIRVSDRLRRIFDLSADPDRIAACLRSDPELRPRLRRHPGLRVPGAWDGFELAVRAILGQQVSVRGATTLAGRIAHIYGEKLPGDLSSDEDTRAGTPTHLFPTPSALVKIEASAVGLTTARARAISSLARATVSGEIDLEASAGLEESVGALCELPGIGPWTAQYIAMRALREPDAFPAGDLGLRKALAGPGDGPAPERQVARRAEAWRPWRAYAALHLWTTPEITTRKPAIRRKPNPQNGSQNGSQNGRKR
jgi:AraC family transcriptional regulator of adaptative response / DNA-3-methyladenine glycosylase II